MKYLILVTTAFDPARQPMARVCVDHLYYQFKTGKYDGNIVIVCNRNEDFFKWDTGDAIKAFIDAPSNSIGAKLNVAFKFMQACDYFINIHDDMLIHDPLWIDKFTKLFKSDDKCGQIGLNAHSFGTREDRGGYEKVTWSDGVFFTSVKNMWRFGRFDESYLGDCEMQDYCYRMGAAGLNNYRITNIPYAHGCGQFIDKLAGDKEKMKMVLKTREALKTKWINTKIADTDKLVWA